MAYDFDQVDVFGGRSFGGNPLAVVHDADGPSTAQLQEFARWTNLSETTFLLPPTTSEADYRVRIFTGSEELPFAGHPTLGSCHAWLRRHPDATRDTFVQECGVGLVRLRRSFDELVGEQLAFAAPPLINFGPVDPDRLKIIADALGIGLDRIERAQHIDNGPGWVGIQLTDAEQVLSVSSAGLPCPVGVVGPCPPGGPYEVEVRGFFPSGGSVFEDPVTGSLNAALAQWLVPLGVLPNSYRAHQGTQVGADGVITIEQTDDGTIWVGGRCATKISGTVDLGDPRADR